LLALWSSLASRPRFYRFVTGMMTGALARMAGPKRVFTWLPFLGDWVQSRDFVAPEGGSFFDRYRAASSSSSANGEAHD
jgi:L-lactate dehydrogenase complex protein LldF